MGGINGSGKTTVLSSIIANNKEIGFIKGSEFFMKWLGVKKGDYKKLQSLPDKDVLKRQEEMIRYIINKKTFGKSKKIVIIDAHFINIRNGKAQEWVGDRISIMDVLLLIKANPADILRRIELDEKESVRNRNIFPVCADRKRKINLIKIFTGKNEHIFKKYARMYNKQNAIFLNKNGQSAKTAKRINKFLESI